MLAGFLSVLGSVIVMPVCHVRMMAGFLVIASFVLASGRLVMPGSFLVMVRGLAMMICCFLGHWVLLRCEVTSRRSQGYPAFVTRA